jgi:hypothetical protein
MHVHERITVNRPPAQVYAFWRNLSQLPQFMDHLVSVQGDPEGITRWTAKSPIGTVDWDAKVVEDKPNEMISWRSLEDSGIRNSGAVRFFAAGAGATEVAVDISYDPPMGRLGEIVASLLGESPDQEISSDLKRFKEIMESGQADVSRSPAAAPTVAAAATTVPAAAPKASAAREDPKAAAAREELIESRAETHAATNRGVYSNDLNPQKVDNDAPVDDFVVGGPMAANIGYPSTGLVGVTDAADAAFMEGERTAAGAGNAEIANDVDPDQLGLRSGQDQNKHDPNDRDAGHRDGEPPEEIGYRVSGAPI